MPGFLLADVLRRLVVEGISIRDLRRILMALADWGRFEDDPLILTEYVRAALKRQITHRLSRGRNQIVVLLLDRDLEDLIHGSMKHIRTGSYLDLPASELKRVVDAVAEPFRRLPDGYQIPAVLTTMEIRSTLRRLIAPSFIHVPVTAYQELTAGIDIQPLGCISLEGFQARHPVFK